MIHEPVTKASAFEMWLMREDHRAGARDVLEAVDDGRWRTGGRRCAQTARPCARASVRSLSSRMARSRFAERLGASGSAGRSAVAWRHGAVAAGLGRVTWPGDRLVRAGAGAVSVGSATAAFRREARFAGAAGWAGTIAVLDVADRALDDVDRSLEGVAVGLDDHGVVGGAQGRDRPVAIEVVADPELLADGLGLVAGRIQAALVDPPHRALLDRGVEEQLEIGIGQHDRPDVAPRDDDPAALRERALAREQGRPHVADLRHVRHRGVNVRAARLVGRVRAVQEDAGQPAGAVVGERDATDQVDEAGRVVGRDAFAQRGRGQRPVQEAGVDEAQAETARRCRADAALAARGGAVERDHDPPPVVGRRGFRTRSRRPGGRGHRPEHTGR